MLTAKLFSGEQLTVCHSLFNFIEIHQERFSLKWIPFFQPETDGNKLKREMKEEHR
ncbi:MAG TPA: hypothetical protein VJ949_10145 [Cryomorphaceae bacterium]|nr:hypothetical protein [Cryomorphaceae bacterium]